MYSELAVLRQYDYLAVKAVKEDHRDFVKRHISFITSSSASFEDLDEEELLDIIPFLEFKTFPKGALVVRKVWRRLRQHDYSKCCSCVLYI